MGAALSRRKSQPIAAHGVKNGCAQSGEDEIASQPDGL